jgi:hypothetical protein
MAADAGTPLISHAQGAGAPTDQATREDKRSAPRFPASEVPSITGLRIKPHGAEARLVNISASGLLAECGVRLQSGSVVSIQFEGTFSPTTVEGRVVRCAVAMVGAGGLRYHVAVAFARTIPLEVSGSAAATASPPAAHAPTREIPVKPAVQNRW